ncbi:AAA family ATPase [Bradyrhizobium japonicum]|uniref:AAA family ATPase n=1 Tax=Bradyrhizobium japonicum TaxID=375 RepID=UPI002714EF6E|nr:AAA family ATPase [Bradyrhizobium japonicum]WLB58820.1 AAA family ATPase [Bradyrhizobium japonicum]WLB59379.1 AAA family ATPase [Bradyrhizobium japonicum]
MTNTHAKLNDESTGLPNPADVEAAFQASNGADAAQAWLAEHGVNYTDAKMIAIDDEAPGDTFVITDAEPDWIALPVYHAGVFADLCLIHRNNPNAFHTICGRAEWFGADNTGRAKVVIHENPVEWLKAGCGGVVSVASGGSRQHFKDLAGACTVECSTLDAANDVWEWTFGGEQKALKKIQLTGDPDEIRDDLAWLAADQAKRRVREALDMPERTDLHRLYRQMDSVFTPKPANDNQKSKFIDGQSLMQMEFEPIKYVIPGYVAEGLTILGGRPKLGKSWLSLDWVVAVATGGRSLGVDCDQGDAFYLALEDNQRRLQDRLKVVLPKMKSMRPDLSRLSFLTEAPKIGEGLVEILDTWRIRAEEPRLIVVDTLAMIRPPKGRNQDSYAADYAALSPLQQYASQHRLALVVVTHVRKMEASDPLEMISGTNGLTGAADSIMVLDRAADGPKLYGRGRDVEEVEKALRFDGGKWSVLGNVDDVKRSDERRKIVEALGNYGAKLSPKDIAEATGMKVNNVNRLLGKMVAAGEVVKDGYGAYSVPPGKSGQTGKSPSTQYLGKSDQNEEQTESDSDHSYRSDRGTLRDAASAG